MTPLHLLAGRTEYRLTPSQFSYPGRGRYFTLRHPSSPLVLAGGDLLYVWRAARRHRDALLRSALHARG